MNPNDAMAVMLKDILLCLLGSSFIYIVYIWLSVSQTSMDDSGHKGNTGQFLNSRVLGVL